MKVLITGSSGLIGSILVGQMRARHEVVGYDRQAPEAVPVGTTFVQGDMLDREALQRALVGVEGVVHLAGIPYDIPPLHEVFSVNVQGTYNALDLAVEAGASHFLFASSIMAYGFGQNVDPQYFPVDEEHPLLANRPYGLSKVVGEQLCRSFSERSAIRTYCFRLTTAVSPGSRYDIYPSAGRKVEVGIYQYFDVRDFATLAENALADKQIQHESFLVSAVDSGHQESTADVIANYYPQAELRYRELNLNSPFVSIEKAQRLLAFAPQHTWRSERGRPI
jgi:UDP-glucose 4-epimerase